MAQRRFATLSGAVLLGLAMATAGGCHGSGGDVPTLEPHDELIFQGGSPLTYRAPANGQVTVYDVNQELTVYTGPIAEDQLFELDPPRQQVRVAGKPTANELRRGDKIRLTFQPAGM